MEQTNKFWLTPALVVSLYKGLYDIISA